MRLSKEFYLARTKLNPASIHVQTKMNMAIEYKLQNHVPISIVKCDELRQHILLEVNAFQL